MQTQTKLRGIAKAGLYAFPLLVAALPFLYTLGTVDGSSMLPTFENGESVAIDKAVYRLHPPQRGDIIVFHHPMDPNRYLIKRVIGVVGDTIEIKDGQLIRNGEVIQEPYIAERMNGDLKK
jgi:signal peptidase I